MVRARFQWRNPRGASGRTRTPLTCRSSRSWRSMRLLRAIPPAARSLENPMKAHRFASFSTPLVHFSWPRPDFRHVFEPKALDFKRPARFEPLFDHEKGPGEPQHRDLHWSRRQAPAERAQVTSVGANRGVPWDSCQTERME